jgi:predicted permease
MLRSLISGARALLHPVKRNAQIEDELKSFFEASVEDKVRRGMSPEEARQAARIEIGSREMVRHKVWSAGWESWVDSFVRDLRFGARQIKKSPGFAAVTVVTLALGIGANTAIFLLTYSLLLKSLPVPDPGQLVRYSLYGTSSGDEPWLSYRQYEALRIRQGPTSGMFAWNDNDATVVQHGNATPIPVGLATGSVFRVLGLHPYFGRAFEEQAGEPGQPLEHEVLVSYDYWKRCFSSDPHILGRTLDLNHTEMTIVGVLPRGFSGISPGGRDDLLLPLPFERVIDGKYAAMDEAGTYWLYVFGRLKPGATIGQARAALSASNKLIKSDGEDDLLNPMMWGNRFWLRVVPGRTGESSLRQTYTRPLIALEALCGLMMLLCAVNVALLVLARVSSRLHEFAVRSALGAARSRLASQVLMETALLGVGGLGLGGVVGWELAHALVAIVTLANTPPTLNLQAGAAIVLFAALLSLGAALLAGLWPALRASHTAPAMDLKQARTQRRAEHLGRWLIPSQVALGMVLIYAAVLMAGTLRNYMKENSGFTPNGITFAELHYQNTDQTDPQQVRKAYALAEALRYQPGIESVALLSMPPERGWLQVHGYFSRDGKGQVRWSQHIWDEDVTEGYFATLGTKIVEGRGFARGDSGSDKVCVISRSAAHFFFPGEDPIGRFITEGYGQPHKGKAAKEPATTYRVIGVAEDARMQSLAKPAPRTLYALFTQEKHPSEPWFLAVRSSSGAQAAAAIRQEAARILPGAIAPEIYTFNQAVDADLSRERLLTSVSGGFGLLALALVGAGLFGVLSRAVTERRREIGIRMALGAERKRIVATLARSAAIRIGIGVVAGAVLAALAGRLMKSLLYGVSAGSPLVALATLGLLLAVLTTAFVLPAGRAASIQPMEAIREE